MKLTRRDFVKGVGAGTAFAGLSGTVRSAPAKAAVDAKIAAAPMPRDLEARVLSRLKVEGSTDPLAASRPDGCCFRIRIPIL